MQLLASDYKTFPEFLYFKPDFFQRKLAGFYYFTPYQDKSQFVWGKFNYGRFFHPQILLNNNYYNYHV